MNECRFLQVVVIGYGAIANNVLRCLYNHKRRYGYRLAYVEHEIHLFSPTPKYAMDNGIDYVQIGKKGDLLEYFVNIAHDNILIVSAGNNYLFPARLIEKSTVTAINFHNALLPKYPGKNAPSWAIYEKEKVTGITWHYITEGIDDGNIIIQKTCEISDEIRAYQLASQLMKLAAIAFEECVEGVLTDNIQSQKQMISGCRKVYRANEIPGEGHFCLTDSPIYIYRLLRSMDYGKSGVFPLPVTELNGETIQITRYCILQKEARNNTLNRLFIPFDNERDLMLQYIAIKK